MPFYILFQCLYNHSIQVYGRHYDQFKRFSITNYVNTHDQKFKKKIVLNRSKYYLINIYIQPFKSECSKPK